MIMHLQKRTGRFNNSTMPVLECGYAADKNMIEEIVPHDVLA